MTSSAQIDMTVFDNFLSARTAAHGNLRMEEEVVTPPVMETPPVVEETPPVVEVPPVEEEIPPVVEDDPEAAQVKELPEWAQKLITGLRAGEANYRTRATSAETKLADAKTPEEVAAAVADIKAENAVLSRSLLVSDVAREFELPAELADVLKGTTKDELKAHAKTLAKFAGSSEPGQLGGGLTPGSDEAFDPEEVARAARRRRG